MKEIVFIKNDDVFTDSQVIAEQTGNQHHAVTQLICKSRCVEAKKIAMIS